MEAEKKIIPEVALKMLLTQEARMRESMAAAKMEQQRGNELVTAIGASLGIDDFTKWKRSEDGKSFVKLAVKGAE